MTKARGAVRFSALLLAYCALSACGKEEAPGPDGGTDATGGGGTGEAGSNGCFAVPSTTPAPSRDPDLLARAAIVYGSCVEDDGINRNLGYMWNEDLEPDVWYYRTGRQAACLANARCGCAAVKACLEFKITLGDAGTEACAPCTGSTAMECGPGYAATLGCGNLGLVCNPLTGCAATSSSTTCDPLSPPTCDDNGRPQVCPVNSPAYSLLSGPECSKIGLACSSGRCTGTGGACNEFRGADGVVTLQGVACVGQDLDACVGAKHATIHCADRGPGFSCRTFGGVSFCGLASECSPALEDVLSPTLISCEGNSVVICNAGRIDKIDCTTLGFTGCEYDKSQRKYGCVPGPTY